jgi:hypothetical protein
MTTAMLVQEESPKASPGVQILSVESTIDGISLSRLAREARSSEARPFDFDVELSESAWGEDTFSVRYTFRFGVPACGQTCKVSGRAVVRFSQYNPVEDLQTLGSDVTSEMVVEIFRKNYQAVYLLHQALGMKPPTPWITQDVSLSSRSQLE